MNFPLLIFLLGLFLCQCTIAQQVTYPRNLKTAVKILMIDCPDSLKNIITKTSNDSLIYLCYPWGGKYNTINEWFTNGETLSPIDKYLIKKGVCRNAEQQLIVMAAFKQKLVEGKVNQKYVLMQYENHSGKRINRKKQLKIRYKSEIWEGEYIPKDLDDAIIQLDKLIGDSIFKAKFKAYNEEEISGMYHFTLGLWIRNNWQLWNGSRLSKYFNEKGIYHPDDMSGIILDSYHRYLTGQEINLQQQIDYYNAYWKVNNEPSKNNSPKGEKHLEFNITQVYNLKQGNIPACVHIQSNSKTDKVWIYDYHFGWKQLSKEELKKLESTTCENMEETIRKLFGKQE
jgi:hypothetical protein